MHKYGLPYRNACGHIFPKDIELVEMMLDAAKKFPDVHVVTDLENGWTVNRYEKENAICYYLYQGDKDPELEFTQEVSLDDYTEEELARSERNLEKFRNREYTPTEIAAINFAMNALLHRSSEEK